MVHHNVSCEATATSWTLISAAAAGGSEERERFARRYRPVVKAYLRARWRTSALLREQDDALQEVFFECFKQQGLLDRAQERRRGGFRAFLYGATRNVTCRFEERFSKRQRLVALDEGVLESGEVLEEAVVRAFDRAWAMSTVGAALEEHARWADGEGSSALRRVELLRLRFEEGRPIREIARLWGEESRSVHREYAKARREFEEALRRTMVAELGEGGVDLEQECRVLMGHLQAAE